MFLLQTYILVIKKVQTYSNMLSIPVKMFFNHLTAWLKPHRKKPSTVKKFKTRLMVQNKKKTGLKCQYYLLMFKFAIVSYPSTVVKLFFLLSVCLSV